MWGVRKVAVKAVGWYACGDSLEAVCRSSKLTGRRLCEERVAKASDGPEGEDEMETWVRGRSGSGPYTAPQRCIFPRLNSLTGRVGERYAKFIAFVARRQWRDPR